MVTVLTACNPIGKTTVASNLPADQKISLQKSLLLISDTQVAIGETITLSFYLKDDDGKAYISTVPKISIELSGSGTSSGAISAVVNNGDGSYSATFTATTAGSVCLIQALVNAKPVTSTLPEITVTNGTVSNTAPVASAQSVSTNEDTVKAITLSATDAENDALTYSVVGSPSHGTLGAISGAGVSYTPALNFNGSDSFTFKANDGHVDSNTVTVSITVVSVNDAPNTPASISCITSPIAASTLNSCTLTAASPVDVDTGDTVTYVDAASTCGSVVVTASTGAVTFTAPLKGATCSIKVKAYDTHVYSGVLTSATITGQNRAPVATAQSLNVNYNTATVVTLSGADADGDSLTYTVVASPSHGSLSGTAPNLTYTPTGGYLGADSFTFKVNDGTTDSTPATVSIAVRPPPIYFCDQGDHSWNNSANWFNDSSCLDHAGRQPTNGDSVIIVSGSYTDAAPALTLANYTGGAGQQQYDTTSQALTIDSNGHLLISSGGWSGTTLDSSVTVDFWGDGYLVDAGETINGNVTFHSPTSYQLGGIITGNAQYMYAISQTIRLDANSDWGGNLYNYNLWANPAGQALDRDGNPILHWVIADGKTLSNCLDSTSNPSTSCIQGDLTFEDTSSYNGGTFGATGQITFNGSAILAGPVTGSVTFRDTSYLSPAGSIDGDALFYDTSWCGGQINGNATLYNHSYLDNYGPYGCQVTSNATFNNFSVNRGVVYGIATFNDDSYNAGLDNPNWIGDGYISGSAVFNDRSHNDAICNGGPGTCPVASSATFNGTSVNHGFIDGNALFNDQSNNLGTVYGSVTWGAGNPNGPIAANSTIYFCDQGDALWATVGNWFADSACSTLAHRIPADGDSVVMQSGTFTDVAPATALASFVGSISTNLASETANLSISAGGTLTITGGYWYGTSDVTATVSFSGASENHGTVDGDATFHGSSVNYGLVTGNAVFYDNSSNWSGTVNGDATFNDSSTADGGTVNGSITWGAGNPNAPILAANSTIYFCDQGDSAWATNGNWFTDSGCTTLANRIPADGDSVVIVSGQFIDTAPATALANFTGALTTNNSGESANLSIGAGGVLQVSLGYWFGSSDASATVHFMSSGYNRGNVNGDATFSDGSGNNGGTVSGNATFNDTSFNNGTVIGNATFTYAVAQTITFSSGMLWGAGTSAANLDNSGNPILYWVFNSYSINYGYAGDSTFNDTSANSGNVLANATFNDNSVNSNLVSGDATFNDMSSSTGTVYGDTTWGAGNTNGSTLSANSTMYYCGIDPYWAHAINWFRDAGCSVLANRRPANGDFVVIQSGIFGDSPSVSALAGYSGEGYTDTIQTVNLGIAAGGTLSFSGGVWAGTTDPTATVTFSGISGNFGTILGNATFNDSSINYSNIGGDATFNDSSYNYHSAFQNGTVNGTCTDNSSNPGGAGC